MARYARLAFVATAGSELEETLAWQMRIAKLPIFEIQYKFHPTRKWAADFAFLDHRLLVEVEGGTWSNGRHNRGAGFLADCVKYNSAAALGWRIVRLDSKLVEDGRGLTMVEEALAWNPLEAAA